MEKVMTNGFCELNEQEMMMVDGGASNVTTAVRAIGGAALLIGVGACAILSAPVSVPTLLVGAAVSGVSIGATSWAY